ncbi:reverse transcriptase [Phytophthora megakarya]|uniref:Reverse transcriptase n=1 Tax=Phytophthora megakarya TaxID=4795 RepID=A0A225VXE4_9STRA|nr:reverse transcriptase [Phytophthora megakarya]
MPSTTGIKRQKMTPERVKPSDDQLAQEDDQVLVASEVVKPSDDQLAQEDDQVLVASEALPKTYTEATSGDDQDERKKTIVSELELLTTNKKWKLVPRPAHQRPIRCRLVFALKRNDKGEVVRHKARLVTKETYAPVAYLNSIRAVLAKCCAEGFEIEQCYVDTAFLYGKVDEEIYMELPEGLCEIRTLVDAEGEENVVCLLLQSLYSLKEASRVWNETINGHVESMGFKAADADHLR